MLSFRGKINKNNMVLALIAFWVVLSISRFSANLWFWIVMKRIQKKSVSGKYAGCRRVTENMFQYQTYWQYR